MEMQLCFLITERMWVCIVAALEDGCLTVEGCDAGEAVREFWHDDDYEYGYRFDKANTDRLFQLICRAGETREEALLRTFHGPDACTDLKQFCDANGIEYYFWSWI